MPALSIIIPTKDRGDIFLNTLYRAIESSAHADVEIIVVNNSLSPIKPGNKPPNVSVYDNPNNKDSVFSSRNYGASIAKSPILLFMDDDILITKEAVNYTIAFHKEHEHACFNVNWQYPSQLTDKIKNTIFGSYLIKHGFSSLKGLYNSPDLRPEWRDDKPFKTPYIASFFFCIKKEDFIKIGGYNEKHLHEGTDVDLYNALAKNNIAMWINPCIMVYHNEEDRANIVNWLERKKRLGAIDHSSILMGAEPYRPGYPLWKRIIYSLIYFMQPLFLAKIRVLDALKIKAGGSILVDLLLGANLCKGYYSVKE